MPVYQVVVQDGKGEDFESLIQLSDVMTIEEEPDETTEWVYGDPCPNCGHTGTFGETCQSHGVSYFDDEGNIVRYEEDTIGEPLYVDCPECGTVLIDELT